VTSVNEPELKRRVVVAGMMGNILEWYDFSVYGYFAQAIGREFFPTTDPMSSVLAAFGAFAVGFLMRPFGAVLFGHIGDRWGRQRALELSVLCMAVPTFLIGVLPGYATLGATAGVLLVLLRMLQGLSVGGEGTTSIIFLLERSPARRHGLAGSMAFMGATAGILLGSALGALSMGLLGSQSLYGLGWRLPMLLGLLVGAAGLYIRRHLPEEAPTAPRGNGVPLLEAVRRHTAAIGLIVGITVVMGVSFYLSFVYAVTYVQEFSGLSAPTALMINTLSMVLLLGTTLLGGWLADRGHAKGQLLIVAGAMLVLAWPLFWLLHQPDPARILAAQVVLALLSGLYTGGSAVLMYAQLPKHLRCTVLSLGFNLGVGVVGGLTPLIATLLIEKTQDVLAPGWYLAAAAALSLVALLFTRRPLAAATAGATEMSLVPSAPVLAGPYPPHRVAQHTGVRRHSSVTLGGGDLRTGNRSGRRRCPASGARRTSFRPSR
jgi:MHS family proline/betaine transporter-like MFS transporter